MTRAPRNMNEVAAALVAAADRYPGFRWYTAPALDNGRYLVDRDTATVYVDGRQTPADAAAALLDAIDELASTSGLAQVISLQARGLSGNFLTAMRSR